MIKTFELMCILYFSLGIIAFCVQCIYERMHSLPSSFCSKCKRYEQYAIVHDEFLILNFLLWPIFILLILLRQIQALLDNLHNRLTQ